MVWRYGEGYLAPINLALIHSVVSEKTMSNDDVYWGGGGRQWGMSTDDVYGGGVGGGRGGSGLYM